MTGQLFCCPVSTQNLKKEDIKRIMQIILRRFLELLIPEIVLSAIITFISANEYITNTHSSVGAIMLLSLALYLFYNFYLLRGCCEDLDIVEYYVYNLISYILFVGVNAAFYLAGNNTLYTWLFSITKTISVVFQQMKTLTSIKIFHCLVLALIFIAPYTTYKKSSFWKNLIWSKRR